MTNEELATKLAECHKKHLAKWPINPTARVMAQVMLAMSAIGDVAKGTLDNDWGKMSGGIGRVLGALIAYCQLQDLCLIDCLEEANEAAD